MTAASTSLRPGCVNSELVVELRGALDEGTYGAMETVQPAPRATLPPAQSADTATDLDLHPDQAPL